jgi:chromosome segregation ATPase
MENGSEPATKADMQVLMASIQALTTHLQAVATDVQTIKGDIQGLETRFDQKLVALETRLNQKMEALEVNWNIRFHEFEHRMEEWCSDMEGRTMTTLYRLMDSGNKRLTEAERETAIIKERLAILEDRLLGVEKRLDTPPRAQ